MVGKENIYLAYFSYAFIFTIILYISNFRESLRLMGNYAALSMIMFHLCSNTVLALDYSLLRKDGFLSFRFVNVRGGMIIGFYTILLGYAYLMVINFINNYRYSLYPVVKNWNPRLINQAALARNKSEVILAAHNKSVPKNKMAP